MYLKLALKNMKQSTKDYLIYMITLVLSVAMFYGFFSIVSPYYSNMLPISIHMEILNKAMRIAVPAVGILILFLVSYVNRYMLKRKQKEFALQTIIGMEQRTVAWIFFLENLMIGALALILGILSGTILSQLINAAVLKAFKQEFKLYFMLFPDTVLWTVCFFGIIFFITGLKNVRTIRKMKIIDMIQNSQKGTQFLNLHQQFGKSSWCVAALSAVILIMLSPIVSIKNINITLWMKIGGTIITALGNCILVCWFFMDRRKKRTGSLIYFLTIVFGIVCFVIMKKKRYKVMPLICLIMFICFIGCGIISILSLTLPYGELLFYPFGATIFGLIFILVGVNDLYSLLRCREKVDGVYCGYNTYYGGNGISTQSPIFEYTYNGTYYREQTTQNISHKRLNRSMTQGNVYSIYIDPKHPAVFILAKKINIGTIVSIILGLFLFTGGIDSLLKFLSMLLGR